MDITEPASITPPAASHTSSSTGGLGLVVDAGSHSIAGIKPQNEDCVGFLVPENGHQLENKGIAIAVADGVSSAEAGKEASHTAVKNFINDYYQTPDPWSVSHAGQKILTAINLKLFRKSHEFVSEEKGYLCTFSGMIIKSHIGHIFHAGDSRIYRLRAGELTVLTRDHVANLGKGHRILARAVGMDNSLQIDYAKQQLEQGDIFLLTSDGVHDFLDDACLLEMLQATTTAQEKAEALVERALEADSDDNISCAVLEIKHLPTESLDDYNLKLTRLPFPPPLEAGMKIDGFEIKKELFASSRSQLYLVEDMETGVKLVMKTPSINFEEDTSYIDRFIQEEWIGKRIDSPYVVKIYEQKRPRTFLYYLMEYLEGETLEKWMAHNRFPKPKVAIRIVEQIAEGLQCFHDQETIHQDMKPGNVMITPDGNVKLLDFGSVFVAGIAEIFRPIMHEGALGTASYSDPQYLLGTNSGVQGDLYALATMTYEMFTGELPFGKKIEECQSALDYDRLRYRNAHEFNPIIPVWFDRALERGLAFDLEKRYSTMAEFLRDLHNPNPEYLLDDPQYTKDKNKAMFWQVISGFWLVTLMLVVMLFSCQG